VDEITLPDVAPQSGENRRVSPERRNGKIGGTRCGNVLNKIKGKHQKVNGLGGHGQKEERSLLAPGVPENSSREIEKPVEFLEETRPMGPLEGESSNPK